MKQTITQDEFLAEARRRFGPNVRDWKFVCPACGTVQSVQQLLDAGVPKEKIDGVIGFSCIGRFTGQGDAGIAAKHRGENWQKGCNWTLGGLLQIHGLEVLIDGKPRPTFNLAEATEQSKAA